MVKGSVWTQKGTIFLGEIKFNKIFEKTVQSNNNSSGRVTLPKELIGKMIYIVVPESKG